MSKVWYVIPSKRPPEEAEPVLRQWQKRGYQVFIQRDESEINRWTSEFTFAAVHYRPYAGYAEAVNYLAKTVLSLDPECEWIVTGGDDMLPDPNKSAEEIAQECREHFSTRVLLRRLSSDAEFAKGCPDASLATFGVMQPTGDDFGASPNATDPAMRGPYCTRVAGSPWMGREWCRRINGGRGPLWPEYFHMGEDEELQAVAIKYGVFWQRPDLRHEHRHWARPREGEKLAPVTRMPEFLTRANSQEEWQKMKKLLAERKAAGWPGTEPIA